MPVHCPIVGLVPSTAHRVLRYRHRLEARGLQHALMIANEIDGNEELQKTLWACYEYWRRSEQPEDERVLCHAGVARLRGEESGGAFPEQQLHQLAALGFLEPMSSSRRAQRRYYKLTDPRRIRFFLRRWGLIDEDSEHPEGRAGD